MHSTQLHFLKNLNNDSYSFYQTINLKQLPILHSIFEYTEKMFDKMRREEKDNFKNLHSFIIGNYYVKTIMDRKDTAGDIDYIIELVHNINKS